MTNKLRTKKAFRRNTKRPPAPWRICDSEVSPDTPDLPNLNNLGTIFRIFRFEGAVIGEDVLPAQEMPLKFDAVAAQVREACGANVARLLAADAGDEDAWTPARAWSHPPPADPLDRTIADRLSATLAARRRPVDTTKTSIVICTKGRAAALRSCLAGVGGEIAAGREVVVVDNGPDAATEAVVRAVDGVRYVVEPRPGVNRARNTGLASVSGDIVVYLDDDVVPEPGWLEALTRRFDDPSVACVCGMVLPYALDVESQIAFQFDSGFGGMGCVPLRFDRKFLQGWKWAVPVWEIGASANMAVRVDHVKALGWLDERLGPGATGGCGDDSEFWHRALQRGFAVLYEPLAVVRHQHRTDFEALDRQARGYAMGHVVAQLVQYSKHRDHRSLLEVYVRRPWGYLRRIARYPDRLSRGHSDRRLFVQISGYLEGLSAFQRIRSQPTTSGRD